MVDSMVAREVMISRVRTELAYRREVFQGDYFSSFLYCLSIAPISHALEKTGGYWLLYLDYSITHQYFMDDLKSVRQEL